MSGISTHGQRLQWQHDERTAGIYAEPSLAEELEARDEEFRHWDEYTFASAATKPLGSWTRERGAAASSSDDGGAPTNREALASGPLESQGLAPSSVERWMWTA